MTGLSEKVYLQLDMPSDEDSRSDQVRIRQALQAMSSESIQFASVPDFIVRMQAAKFVPHTDMTRYPTIAGLLKEC